MEAEGSVICWNQIALVTEFLNLRQEKKISSEGNMTDLLDEHRKDTLRVQIWQFEMGGFEEEEAKPRLNLPLPKVLQVL